MKPLITTIFIGIILLQIITPSKAQDTKVFGFYTSNFLLNCFYRTRIQLNENFTFTYEWGGDLSHDRAIGKFKIIDDTVLLSYQPSKFDTIDYYLKDTIYKTVGSSDSGGFHLYKISHPTTVNRHELSPYINDRPSKFYYRHKKLLDINST